VNVIDDCLPCMLDMYRAYNVTDTWNGWLTRYNAGLVLSQQFAAVQLVLCFSTFYSLSLIAVLPLSVSLVTCILFKL